MHLESAKQNATMSSWQWILLSFSEAIRDVVLAVDDSQEFARLRSVLHVHDLALLHLAGLGLIASYYISSLTILYRDLFSDKLLPSLVYRIKQDHRCPDPHPF